ncbi:MAG: apolipoprotein N-acyltransferase, partial [Blastocatellia bacterium]|nr:apolipoprotein N-acyltransferase [Blastocatellia bacterium]
IALFFAAILAIFPGAFAAALSLLVRRFGWPAIALAPIVWVATEWLRPAVTGVTWNALGISQAQYFPIAKLARFGGVYLVSAQVVTAAALIVLFFKIRERKVARAFAALLLGAALMFALAGKEAENSPASGATVDVLGVQPNLMPNSSDTEEAWRINLEATIRLTRGALERSPGKSAGIIVWSESPLVLFYENDASLRMRLDNLARETGSYLILNTVAHEGEQYFNSISTISPHGDDSNWRTEGLKRYDKTVLVPFGEYVPW